MRRVFGGIFLAAGILIAGGSGLCSLIVMSSMMDGGEGGDVIASLSLVMMFGGVPFLIGLGLFFIGRSMLKAPDYGDNDTGGTAGTADATNTTAATDRPEQF